MGNLFYFGFGYVARRLAQDLNGWTLAGTTRQSTKEPSAIPLHLFGENHRVTESILDQFDCFLISIPPAGNKDIVLAHYWDYFTKRSRSIRWIGYLSATSVYGDHKGACVTEESDTQPSSPRGQARLYCEQQWLELGQTYSIPVHVFRLSGIYGPHRNVLATIMNETPQLIEAPTHLFSRIHVDDICQTLVASIQNPSPLAIYNLADDLPTATADVYEYGYQLVGQKPPKRVPLCEAKLSAMAAEFYRDQKRICNHRIKHDLQIDLLYPTYREGLQQCYDELKERKGWQL